MEIVKTVIGQIVERVTWETHLYLVSEVGTVLKD